MKTKHTPGRWEAKTAYVFAGNDCIAVCDTDNDTDARYQANAHLIAAAPDMLEALEGIEHFSDAIAFRDDPLSKALREWIAAGHAAISKATGGRP